MERADRSQPEIIPDRSGGGYGDAVLCLLRALRRLRRSSVVRRASLFRRGREP